MKKKSTAFLITLAILFCATAAQAQQTKLFTLKDGSKIKGKLINAQNGIYTIETETLGSITIEDSKVLSMSDATLGTVTTQENPLNAAPTGNPFGIPPGANASVGSGEPNDFKSQTLQVQQQLMMDPDVLSEIQTLIEDPDIQSLLTDQQFISDIMTYDPQRIQNNPKTHEMMNNPKIQLLLKKLYGKMTTPQQP